MTISSATRKAGPFLGNGVASTFPFTFKVFQASDLQVIKTSTLGVDSLLVLNSDYSISLNADQNANPGGTITYPLAGALLQTGEKLTGTGVLGALQQTHITNGGNFFANNIEDQMDYLTILTQQLNEQMSRVALASSSDLNPVLSIGTAVQRASKYITFDASGNISLATSLPSGTLSQASIVSFLGADPIAHQTAAEIAASITPTSYAYPEGDLRRYGGVGDGATNDSVAWQRAVNVGIVRIPKGYSFKIVTPATKTGQVTILGEGRSSKLLCDGLVLQVNSGTGSIADNFWMENITAPWIITRNPLNWSSPPFATLQQSNSVLGYQPTVNDVDIWSPAVFVASQAAAGANMVVASVSVGAVNIGMTLTGAGVAAGTYITGFVSGTLGGPGTYTVSNTTGFASTTVTSSALTTPQQNQQIGPTITFTGNSSDITVSRIYGRFVVITIMDSQFSQFRDCDIRGGKGVWGGLVFDNATNNTLQGLGNSAVGNTVRYASFSGITFLNNNRGVLVGNESLLNGESGLKPGSGPNTTTCNYCDITGNSCSDNYYDGIDATTDVPTDDTIAAYHNIVGNHAYRNNGTGINLSGTFNNCVGNFVHFNNRHGIWCVASLSRISNNFVIDNNQSRNPTYHEILGGNTNNQITDNYIWSGAGANSSAIFAQNTHYIKGNYAVGSNFNFGVNAAATTSYLEGNVDATIGKQVEQSFIWGLNNNAGTLQHSTYAQSGAVALGNFQSRLLNASSNPTNTPTGADASTPMAAGWKIGSGSTNNIWADTNDQLTAANALLMCSIAYNDTGTEVRVRPQIASININGVTRLRLTFQFFTAAGAAFALNTTNVPTGKTLQVQFYGKLV